VLTAKKKNAFSAVLSAIKPFNNQSIEGAEFVLVSECQNGEGSEIMNQIVFV
jgi:hypothetical protein